MESVNCLANWWRRILHRYYCQLLFEYNQVNSFHVTFEGRTSGIWIGLRSPSAHGGWSEKNHCERLICPSHCKDSHRGMHDYTRCIFCTCSVSCFWRETRVVSGASREDHTKWSAATNRKLHRADSACSNHHYGKCFATHCDGFHVSKSLLSILCKWIQYTCFIETMQVVNRDWYDI